jgi:hypothetical protein
MMESPGTSDISTTIPPLDGLITAPMFLSDQAGNGAMSHRVPFSNKQPARRFYCPFCENSYDRNARFQHHLNNHLSLKPFTCEGRCGLNGW